MPNNKLTFSLSVPHIYNEIRLSIIRALLSIIKRFFKEKVDPTINLFSRYFHFCSGLVYEFVFHTISNMQKDEHE